MYRLGIDIGGTFTDILLLNEQTGESLTGKVPSTPEDPSVGFLNAVNRIMSDSDISPSEVEYLIHATTIATNSIIEGKIARTGFVTTDGFRDMLEIARQIRPSLYDLQFEKPAPLVPRYLAIGIPERLDAQGDVLLPLDEKEVHKAAKALKDENVEAVAVCFLHSYINPDHERRVGEIFADELPDTIVSLSSEVAPEFREYFRASTTVINAAISPIVKRYLQDIEDRLRRQGLTAELLVMQSGGGVLTFEAARDRPVFMVESGPAAGAVAAAYLGTSLGRQNVLSFDMGGTTAKTCLIQEGTPTITKDYQVGAEAGRNSGAFGGAGGYPIRTPVIDLSEIGSGGGSIAWVDSGGLLRVGPQSAGADPGPVCYSSGGTEPTVTDANLVLGRLDPEYFLGGEIKLDLDGARKAIEEKCARPLGLTLEEAAQGIIEIANAEMVNALRLVSINRGYDPRDFLLVAFGGAGPVHANRIAAELEIPNLMVPNSPGVFSATGLLVTDLKHDYSVTMIQKSDEIDADSIEQAFSRMHDLGREALSRESVKPEEMSFERAADMRYYGQSFELTIPLPDETLTGGTLEDVLQSFHDEHEQAYGFAATDEPIEFVNLRITAIGNIVKPALRKLANLSTDSSDALTGHRPVYFEESGGWTDCPIYSRYRLGVGTRLTGPTIIEERDSTTVVHPGYNARVDEFGNLLIGRSEVFGQSD